MTCEGQNILVNGSEFTVFGSASNNGTYTAATVTSNLITLPSFEFFVTESNQSVDIYTDDVNVNSTASANITTSNAGSSLITITATTDTGQVLVTTLRVVSKDPEYRIHDYGICN